MLYALTFVAGAMIRTLVDAYLDRRRRDGVEAWREVFTGKSKLTLAQELRLRGMYDQPETYP